MLNWNNSHHEYHLSRKKRKTRRRWVKGVTFFGGEKCQDAKIKHYNCVHSVESHWIPVQFNFQSSAALLEWN